MVDQDVELSLPAESVEELTWYFGNADAAMRIHGIDYRTLAAGGGSQVEDANVHARRILAPMAPSFRRGLWRRAWVELALRAISPEDVEVLALAFTPRRWQLVEDRRSAADRRTSELSSTEQRIRAHLMLGRPGPGEGGVCLLAVALERGIVRAAYEEQPAVVAARAADPTFPEPTRDDLLAFLEKTADHAAILDNKKIADVAAATFQAIRERVVALLAPAVAAYHEAGRSRESALEPGALHRAEREKRHRARLREMEVNPAAADEILAGMKDFEREWR